jgi:hypothetical protein
MMHVVRGSALRPPSVRQRTFVPAKAWVCGSLLCNGGHSVTLVVVTGIHQRIVRQREYLRVDALIQPRSVALRACACGR